MLHPLSRPLYSSHIVNQGTLSFLSKTRGISKGLLGRSTQVNLLLTPFMCVSDCFRTAAEDTVRYRLLSSSLACLMIGARLFLL